MSKDGNMNKAREAIRRLFAAESLHDANLSVRYRGAQIICLIMIWFFIQSSGNAAFGPNIQGKLPAIGIEGQACLQLLNLGAQCTGGAIGSLIMLFRNRFRRNQPPCADVNPAAKRTVLFPALALALSLAFGLACMMAKMPLISTTLRIVACSLVTLLFLETCLAFVRFPLRTVLMVFLLVALCRIAQSIIMLPFASTPIWEILATAAELALLGAYVFTTMRPPIPEAKPVREKGAFPQVLPKTEEPSNFGAERKPALSQKKQADTRRPPWQFIVHVMLYYFVIGLLRLWEETLTAPSFQMNCTYLFASITAFIFFYGFFVRTGSMAEYWVRIRQIAFPLLVTSCAMTGVLDPQLSSIAVVFSQTGYRFFLLASYIELFFICSITDMDVRGVFSITHLAMYVAMFAGGTLGLVVRENALYNQTAVLYVTLLALLCLTAASCWLGNDKIAGKVWGRRIELTPKGRQEELLSETCQTIAKTYHLTAKEREILEHLVHKKSLNQIAEELVVSKNTVRTHVRNLYAKTGAHSQSDVYKLYRTAQTSAHASTNTTH